MHYSITGATTLMLLVLLLVSPGSCMVVYYSEIVMGMARVLRNNFCSDLYIQVYTVKPL